MTRKEHKRTIGELVQLTRSEGDVCGQHSFAHIRAFNSAFLPANAPDNILSKKLNSVLVIEQTVTP